MKAVDHIKMIVLAITIGLGYAAQSDAQGRPPLRVHTTTEVQNLKLVAANTRYKGGAVTIDETARKIKVSSNGVPSHLVGRFPNRGNPHEISGQSFTFSVPAQPKFSGQTTELTNRLYFGVALNGVPFDPGAAEFWNGNPRSGWTYEAMGGAVALGLDANYAHVQPNGSYHYHGLPTGLLADIGWRSDAASPLIGYAADGFPIYAITAVINGRVVEMDSSYQLKPGQRPGGAAPDGSYDGAFVQDYEYAAGSGDLDECNGALVRTAGYPDGIYAYFLTEDFPVIPRCLKGTTDRSFAKG